MPCPPQPCQTARALGHWPDCGKLSGSVKHGPASGAVFVGQRCVSANYRQSENVHPLVARDPCYSVYIPVTECTSLLQRVLPVTACTSLLQREHPVTACAPCYSGYIPVTECTSCYSVCSLLQRVHPAYAPRYSVYIQLQRVLPVTACTSSVCSPLQCVVHVTACTSSYSICSPLQSVHLVTACAPCYSMYIQLQRNVCLLSVSLAPCYSEYIQRMLPVTARTSSFSVCSLLQRVHQVTAYAPRYIVYIQLQRVHPVTACLVPTFCLQALSPAFNYFKRLLVMPPFSAPFLRLVFV